MWDVSQIAAGFTMISTIVAMHPVPYALGVC